MAVALDSTKNLLSQAAKKKSIITINVVICKALLLYHYLTNTGHYQLLPTV